MKIKALYTYKSFADFRDDEVIATVGSKFEPNIINFQVTAESIKTFGELFQDLFPPHLVSEKNSNSIFNKILGGDFLHQATIFSHGLATLSFLSGYVRRIFRFEDGTEIITTGFNKVRFPAPNPVGSKISSTWIIREKTLRRIKLAEVETEAVEIVFFIKLYSDLVPDKVICKAEWVIWYVAG